VPKPPACATKGIKQHEKSSVFIGRHFYEGSKNLINKLYSCGKTHTETHRLIL
jgi:hypothetical protein